MIPEVWNHGGAEAGEPVDAPRRRRMMREVRRSLCRLPAPVHQLTLIPQRGTVCHVCIDAIRQLPIHRLGDKLMRPFGTAQPAAR